MTKSAGITKLTLQTLRLETSQGRIDAQVMNSPTEK